MPRASTQAQPPLNHLALLVLSRPCRTAKDVQLTDAEVPEDFTLLDGSIAASLGKIDAGSSVQHSYVLVPNKGSFGLRFEPATVTYIAEMDSNEKQVCVSQDRVGGSSWS